MSDDALVEALAERLLTVGAEIETSDLGGVDIANFKEIRLALAREALRQMEWARRNHYAPLYEHADPPSKIIGRPLTIAPDDWHP